MDNQFSSEEQAEIDAAWDWYDEQVERKAEEAMRNEYCPCGHRGHQHEGSYCEGQCTAKGCDCPHFGADPSDYEAPPQRVWFTEPPGGHNGWE